MFSAKHTALFLISVCFYAVVDSYDTKIAG